MQGDSAVIVILSGTERLGDIVRSDPQVQTRFSTLVLPLVDADADRDDILAIIDAHCAIAELLPPIEADLVDRLVHAARQRFGLCIEYSIPAIERALLEGAGQSSVFHFAAAWSLAGGDAIDRNIFLAEDWWKIDPDNTKAETHGGGSKKRKNTKGKKVVSSHIWRSRRMKHMYHGRVVLPHITLERVFRNS
jgi:hypothetical protein